MVEGARASLFPVTGDPKRSAVGRSPPPPLRGPPPPEAPLQGEESPLSSRRPDPRRAGMLEQGALVLQLLDQRLEQTPLAAGDRGGEQAHLRVAGVVPARIGGHRVEADAVDLAAARHGLAHLGADVVHPRRPTGALRARLRDEHRLVEPLADLLQLFPLLLFFLFFPLLGILRVLFGGRRRYGRRHSAWWWSGPWMLGGMGGGWGGGSWGGGGFGGGGGGFGGFGGGSFGGGGASGSW